MKVLITEPANFSKAAIEVLASFSEVTLKAVTQSDIRASVKFVDAVFLRLGFKIDKDVIDSANALKYIVCPATGLDHIDTEYAKSKNIRVLSLQGDYDFLRTIPSTAELTWGLMLALLRNIPSSCSDVLNGSWNRESFKGHNLKNKKLGILGFGRVGVQVAEYARAFGMKVAAYDITSIKIPPHVQSFSTPDELLQWCDILSVHIPYNALNHGFLNENLLRKIKKGSWMINTSRSGVWDEAVILEMLTTGYLAGVATDVLSGEPHVSENPLIAYAKKHRNLLITPHLGGATFESMEMCEVYIAEKLKKIVSSCAE